MCVAAPHMMSMVSTSSHVRDNACDTRDVVVSCTRAPRRVRTSIAWGAACFWLSRQCFCSRGVFAAAANVFALCLLGERVFLLVFGPKFNEEVCLHARPIDLT